MQSYLGEYPGSRSDSPKKFIRAVQSFLDQTHKDSELIIASDGCEKTHQLYYELYKNEPRIKYVYIDKDTPNMYEGEIKYYRGLPRQVARSLVTGDITTYMDSDDFLLPNAAATINEVWSEQKDTTGFALIDRWYDNEVILTMDKMDTIVTEPNLYEINGLGSKWVLSKMSHPTLILQSTWAISHRSHATSIWKDIVGEGYSEDTAFSRALIKEFGAHNGFLVQTPFYVRCHFSKLWDY
jgi:glycosyltransferase involved in cell wall biosynthesis